jgi:hypothetical protein
MIVSIHLAENLSSHVIRDDPGVHPNSDGNFQRNYTGGSVILASLIFYAGERIGRG